MKNGFVALLGTAAVASSAAAQTYTYAGPSVAIPDNNPAGTTATLNVAASGTIVDLNVGLLIQHTWQGDLIVSITSPGGTTVGLVNRAGDGNNNGGAGWLADNFGDAASGAFFVLDDSAAEAYDQGGGFGYGNGGSQTGIDNVTGSWLPFNGAGITSLAAFNGEDINGDWVLSVSDNAGGDLGEILSFQLDVTVPAPASMGLLAVAGLAGVRRRR